MTSSKIECVLINPGDLDSYIPTIKNSLLFYDKINITPNSDVAYLMGSPIPDILNQTTFKTIHTFKKRFKEKEKYIKKKVNQKKLDPVSAIMQFKDYVETQQKVLIEENFDLTELKNRSIQEAQGPWDKAKKIRKEVKVLIDEGFVNYPEGDAPTKIANDTSDAFMEGIKNAAHNAQAQLSGGKFKPIPERSTVAFKLWAATAVSMVSLYNCPLLSSKIDFLERIKTNLSCFDTRNKNCGIEQVNVWKYQHMTLNIQSNILPDLRNLNFDEILELRHLTEDFIEPYRRQMAAISKEMRSAPWDQNFENETKAIISTQVKPLLKEAREAFKKHPPIYKILKRAYASFKEGWDSISIVADFFPGSEPFLISACVAAGINGALDEFFTGTTDNTAKNGIVFLIKAETIIDSKR